MLPYLTFAWNYRFGPTELLRPKLPIAAQQKVPIQRMNGVARALFQGL
jgi:hypothetical protein